MSLVEAFRAGGWPMYPILLLGICLLFATVRHHRRAEPRSAALVWNLRAATLLFGVLGTTLGMIHCLMGLGGLPPGAPYGNFALLGLGESLNCTAFALILVSSSVLIATVGTWRAALEE